MTTLLLERQILRVFHWVTISSSSSSSLGIRRFMFVCTSTLFLGFTGQSICGWNGQVRWWLCLFGILKKWFRSGGEWQWSM
jgi:hypothetical protein